MAHKSGSPVRHNCYYLQNYLSLNVLYFYAIKRPLQNQLSFFCTAYICEFPLITHVILILMRVTISGRRVLRENLSRTSIPVGFIYTTSPAQASISI